MNELNNGKNLRFDATTISAVKSLEKHPKELEDAFYTEIAFGTGGMRGIMGPGTNRINQYTLGKASQGVANYLNKTKTIVRQKLSLLMIVETTVRPLHKQWPMCLLLTKLMRIYLAVTSLRLYCLLQCVF